MSLLLFWFDCGKKHLFPHELDTLGSLIKIKFWALCLTKKKLTVLLCILTGQYKLKKYLYQLGNDQTCNGCEEEEETMECMLWHCFVVVVELRGAMLGDHWLNMVMVGSALATLIR